MTEKQYKLEQWSSSSLYYSFPNGSLHHSIGKVITKVENDLNSLYDENKKLKKELKSKEKAHTRCDELYWQLYDKNKQLRKENSALQKKYKALKKDFEALL